MTHENEMLHNDFLFCCFCYHFICTAKENLYSNTESIVIVSHWLCKEFPFLHDHCRVQGAFVECNHTPTLYFLDWPLQRLLL